MKIIFIHGKYGKTTLALLFKKYHGSRARLIHLDNNVKHAISLLHPEQSATEIAKTLGEYYLTHTEKVLQVLDTQIVEIVKSDKDILIIEGIYKCFMNNIESYLNDMNQLATSSWVELETHKHVKLDGTLLKCDFEIDHTSTRDVADLTTYLDTINVDIYFDKLLTEDPRVQRLLSP